jgi:hypothetical protein
MHSRLAAPGRRQAESILQPALQRLREISELGPNWDPYGSEMPSRVATGLTDGLLHAAAAEFAEAADERLLPLHVAPIADGGVQVEWSGDHADLEVYIGPQGTFGYLFINGSANDRTFEEKDDVTIQTVLDRLHYVLDRPVRA